MLVKLLSILVELLVELSLSISVELLIVDNRLGIFLIEKGLKSRFLRDWVACSKRRIDLRKVGLLTI